jgi:hypothetical protein
MVGYAVGDCPNASTGPENARPDFDAIEQAETLE